MQVNHTQKKNHELSEEGKGESPSSPKKRRKKGRKKHDTSYALTPSPIGEKKAPSFGRDQRKD